MVKTVAAKTRKAIVRAAQHSAEKIRAAAADAASAAAQAAAGVVLASTASALEAGRAEVTQSTPSVKKTLGRAAKHTIGRRRAAGGRNHRKTGTYSQKDGSKKSGAETQGKTPVAVASCRRLPRGVCRYLGQRRMTSASGELNDLQRARSQKGLLDVAGGAWQDLGDLIQAELELLRAEISEKLTLTAWSASLIGGGAVLLVATLVLLLQAAIGALVALGVPWLAAVLIVAAVTLVLGGSLVWSGFNNLAHRLTPTKTIAQVQKDAKALTGSE